MRVNTRIKWLPNCRKLVSLNFEGIQCGEQLLDVTSHILLSTVLTCLQNFENNPQVQRNCLKIKMHCRDRPIISLQKAIWTEEEDELLRRIVLERGTGIWKEISEFIPNRSGKQCRQRWHNHLRQGVKKEPWTPEQFWILALCVRAYGRRWSVIADYLPERSDNTIKNQWNCKMKPYKQKFMEEIDRLLLDPCSWTKMQPIQQELLAQIAKTNNNLDYSEQSAIKIENFEQKRNRVQTKKLMLLYDSILGKALKDFAEISQHYCNSEDEDAKYQFQLNEEQSPEEIKGGEGIFEESEDFFLN